MYLKYQITQDDIDRLVTNSTTTATDKLDSTITASFSEGKNFYSNARFSFICNSDISF